MTSQDVIRDLAKLANKTKAKLFQSYFKTGKGEYGEGDIFLGITVPEQRKIARKYKELDLSSIQKLLFSRYHEHRFTALEILVMRYEKSQNQQRREIVQFYLKNLDRVNNWDLVDTSAQYILGDWLIHRKRIVLYSLVKSGLIWKRRVAIIATRVFINNNDFADTLKISSILLSDKHDLIHKASGWMLREVGNKSKSVLINYLKRHHSRMPRTMLRYAIEKLSEEELRRSDLRSP